MEGACQNVEQKACDGSIDGPTTKPFIGGVTEDAFVKTHVPHGVKSLILT